MGATNHRAPPPAVPPAPDPLLYSYKEILSDQGRQFYSWRGPCPFQKELAPEGIHHIVFRLEGQLLKGMVMAAEASLAGGRKSNPLWETQDLEERNRRLRQEVLRSQAMLRLTRKLFKTGSRGPKNGPRRGRPPKAIAPAKPETTPGGVPSK